MDLECKTLANASKVAGQLPSPPIQWETRGATPKVRWLFESSIGLDLDFDDDEILGDGVDG